MHNFLLLSRKSDLKLNNYHSTQTRPSVHHYPDVVIQSVYFSVKSLFRRSHKSNSRNARAENITILNILYLQMSHGAAKATK